MEGSVRAGTLTVKEKSGVAARGPVLIDGGQRGGFEGVV